MDSHVEYLPPPDLSSSIRTMWIHTVGDTAYEQRHLPTGGIEVHVPLGGVTRLLGPLTTAYLDVIPAHTTLIGVRFWPGAAPRLAVSPADLIDQRVELTDVLGRGTRRVSESLADAPSAVAALATVQRQLRRDLIGPDPLVAQAVRHLLPWRSVDVSAVARTLGLSGSQLRRRVLGSVGIGPKTLQRTLRFQGFLALAQAGVAASGRPGADGLAGLAVDVGDADQAHLSRECVRIAGVTPAALLGGDVDRCACGHDHSASFRPLLRTRPRGTSGR